MPDQMVGGKTPPAPKPKAKAPKAKVKAKAPKSVPPIKPGSPGSVTNPLGGSPSPSASPGVSGASTDPFAGTPYAGMTPFQVAQKIISDQVNTQTQAITRAQQLAQSKDQEDLATMAGFNTALQQASSQFAPTTNTLLSAIGQSHQNFAQGWQDTMNTLQGETAPLQPGQQPGYATNNPQGSTGQPGSDFINAAELSNPFNVLPAAYGRLGQMDLTTLANNQQQALTAFGQQMSGATSSQAADTLSLWQSLNAPVLAAQQAAAQSAADSQAAAQKQYQWQYTQASNEAKFLTTSTGVLYQVNPTTLAVTPARDSKTGQLVITSAGRKAGVTEAQANARIKQGQTRLNQNQQNINLRRRIATSNAWYKKKDLTQRIASYNLQQSKAHQLKPASAQVDAQYGYVMFFDPLANNGKGGYERAVNPDGSYQKYKATKTGAGSTSPNRPGTPAYNNNLLKQHTDQSARATREYQALLKPHVSQHVSATGKVSETRQPPITAAQAKAQIAARYLPTFLRIARLQLKAGLLDKKYTPRQIADYWLNQATI